MKLRFRVRVGGLETVGVLFIALTLTTFAVSWATPTVNVAPGLLLATLVTAIVFLAWLAVEEANLTK